MKSSDIKETIIILLLFLSMFVLMHGNEMDEFHNSEKLDAFLWPVLYICSVTILLIILPIKKILKKESLKEKIKITVIIVVLSCFPMFFVSGLIKYIDYYTTDKKWELIDAYIIKKRETHGSRGPTTYYYTIKTADTTIELSSNHKYPVGQKLDLEICRTNLGVVIANNKK